MRNRTDSEQLRESTSHCRPPNSESKFTRFSVSHLHPLRLCTQCQGAQTKFANSQNSQTSIRTNSVASLPISTDSIDQPASLIHLSIDHFLICLIPPSNFRNLAVQHTELPNVLPLCLQENLLLHFKFQTLDSHSRGSEMLVLD